MRVLAILFLMLSPALSRPAASQPNVIVIFLDDSGYGDYAHNGNPTIETPAISKLAGEGVNFTQFYVPSPACSASRYALLTGRYPWHSGFPAWVIGPGTREHLKPAETTLAEALKARGYATGLFGKWHLGSPNAANAMSADALPLAHGFDEWIGTNVSHDYDNALLLKSDPAGSTPVKGYSEIARDLPSRADVSTSLTGLYTEAIVGFIKRHKDAPFLACFTPNQPHLGLYASDRFKGVSRRGLLGDVMAEIDDSVARLLAALDESGIRDNTLVIFSSDNGPWIRYQDTASDPKYGEARLHVGYAQPFRDGKGSNWEGGHRVAGIFHWRGMIPPARQLEPASTLDVLPTVLALCGADIPAAADGRDLSGLLLRGMKPAPFSLAYCGPDNLPSAFREGPWKLHLRAVSQIKDPLAPRATSDKPLLFQVEEDLGERIDRAAEQPGRVARLRDDLSRLRAAER